MKALVSGSFDPPTLGHIALINEAQKVCDELIVCVMVNEEKTALFTLDERKTMLKLCLSETVHVDTYSGLCYEYCITNGIDRIVRGFRNSDDYAYETEMAKFNKKMSGVDTILLHINGLEYVTATKAREVIKSGGDTSDCLPRAVIDFINDLNTKKQLN